MDALGIRAHEGSGAKGNAVVDSPTPCTTNPSLKIPVAPN